MTMLRIKYLCEHPSCVVNCREGKLTVSEDLFKEYASFYNEDSLFRSPKEVCRLGYRQKFKVIAIEQLDEETSGTGEQGLPPAEDPISVLKSDHQEILAKLSEIKDLVRRREIDLLWKAASELEDMLNLHSVKKEEDVLFSYLSGLMAFGEGLIAIVKEDHREVITLLDSFRQGLEEDDILEGIIISVITSMQSHIRKEDGEFFELIEKSLDLEAKKALFADMEKIRAEHVSPPIPKRERKRNKRRELLNDSINDARINNLDSCCH